MICRYCISDYISISCPVGSLTGGTVFNNSFAYISTYTQALSGFGTGCSYLSKADALVDIQENINLTGLAATGCLYSVGVYFTGLCNVGDPAPSYQLSGSAINHDPYLAYLQALASLKALTGAFCHNLI